MYRERRINGVWETDTLKEGNDPSAPTYFDFESGMRTGGRNYFLFALLSGVRQYGPMALKPPAEDRGWPEDAHEIHTACNEQWDSDAHSHGYLDMAELGGHIHKFELARVLYGHRSRGGFGQAVETLEEV